MDSEKRRGLLGLHDAASTRFRYAIFADRDCPFRSASKPCYAMNDDAMNMNHATMPRRTLEETYERFVPVDLARTSCTGRRRARRPRPARARIAGVGARAALALAARLRRSPLGVMHVGCYASHPKTNAREGMAQQH
jgi:hypothetical protein